MKKFLLLLMSIICLTAFISCDNENVEKSNNDVKHSKKEQTESNEIKATKNLAYSLSEDKTYYIVSGIGSAKENEIIIPRTYKNKPVKEIGHSAFRNCSHITSITISDGISTINADAFADCKNMKSIVIPKSVNSLPAALLNGCSSLESITVPFIGDSKKELSDIHLQETFGYIFGTEEYDGGIEILQRMTSSESKYYIPSSLHTVIVEDGEIPYGAFQGCTMLVNITLPPTATYIEKNAFADCTGIKAIDIPNSLSKLGNNAFCYCTSLKSIIIPKGITRIGDDTFLGCSSLESIIIPSTVTSFGAESFLDCTMLKHIKFNGTKTQWYNIENSWWFAYMLEGVQCTDGIIYYE